MTLIKETFTSFGRIVIDELLPNGCGGTVQTIAS
jgi:hypothetical protein